jgi:predicted Zn finger-like uncharacterized protein
MLASLTPDPSRADEDPVDYSCLSCAAKYAIPDERVAHAGAGGLRVRCSRCRAIMSVSSTSVAGPSPASPRAPSPATASRAPASPPRRRSSAVGDEPDGAHRPLTTGVWKNPFAGLGAPGAMAAGAAAATPEPGADVAGAFLATAALPSTASSSSPRVWFCALEGRARGPYTAAELVRLAGKGRVRSSTLLWRPGSGGWAPLHRFVAFDVSWLREAVRQRKQHEIAAEQATLRRRGIVPVRLERRTVRAARPPDVDVVDTVGVAPSAVAPTQPLVFDNLDGEAVPLALAPDAIVASPFVWQAPTGPRPEAGRRRPAVAVAVVVAVVGIAVAVAFVVAGLSGGPLALP